LHDFAFVHFHQFGRRIGGLASTESREEVPVERPRNTHLSGPIALAGMDDWRALLSVRPIVLLEGTAAATHAALVLLVPCLREPIVWKRPGTSPEREAHRPAALILQDVAALDAHEQRALLAWLDEGDERTQVISTATISLFGLVERGLFDARLYYRLNVMLLRVAAVEHDAESTGRPAEDTSVSVRDAASLFA